MKNKKILVVGLGGTGESVLAYCAHINADAKGYDAHLSTERKATLQAKFPQFPLISGSLNDALLDRDVLVLSPGISRRLPEIVAFEARGGLVTGDVAILSDLLRHTNSKIIAITGSNGKTTTTSLVGHLCEKSGLDTVVAGNIGTPVLQAWLEHNQQPADVWVLELSSFQLETTPNLAATAAACLNISEDHLDRYNDLLDYAHTKDAIFNGCSTQVLNADDVFCCAMNRPNQKTLFFSLQKQTDMWLDTVSGSLNSQNNAFFHQSHIPLQGNHNTANILAALALCESIGLPRELLLQHIQTFKGLPHRVEKIGEKNGVIFIDDSKGTNVGATLAAILGLSSKICLILGGLGKGQDFTPLRDVVHDKTRAVFLIGQDAPQIAQDLSDCGSELIFCQTLQEAVQRAYAVAQVGDIVLLSPACASMDMFKNYAHRSQVFIEAFEMLI